MAITGPRRDQSVVAEAGELALAGFQEMGVATQDQLGLIFRTVAKECQTKDEQAQYLMTCKARGLSPLKSELYATRRGGSLVFVVAFGVFVSRARSAGFVISGEAVCEGDEFDGWDAAHNEPLRHVIGSNAEGRGECIGAYAFATHVATLKRLHGGWWNWSELVTGDSGKGGPWRSIPQHMAKRTAWQRVARLIAPDLNSLYGAEEMGVVIKDEADPETRDVEAGPQVIDVTAGAEQGDLL